MYRTFAMIVLMVTLLSACGGGGGDDRSTAATYGTLALSGSGSSIAGAQFKATESHYGTAMWSTFVWASEDGKVLTVQASGNYISSVELGCTSGGKQYKWASFGTAGSIAGVTIGPSSVAFIGAAIGGYLNTTSPLALNGTLTFTP